MKPKQEIEDLFDKEICVECDAKCHPGSGRYVNRYPYYGDEYEDEVEQKDIEFEKKRREAEMAAEDSGERQWAFELVRAQVGCEFDMRKQVD